MKPTHVGLLVIGAALAGGLAVKMTQPPALPAAPAPVAQAAVPVQPAPPKPSPIPSAAPAVQQPQAAPAPVYDEPARSAARKSKPVLTSKLKPAQLKPAQLKPAQLKPTQWTPPLYSAPSQAVPAPAAAPAPPVEQPPVEQAAAPEPAPEITPPPYAAPEPRHVTLRTGMTIPVRLNESLSSDRSVAGDTFQASLSEPLVADGLVIAERGARVTGRIVDAQKAGRVNGTALLELSLASVSTSDGQRLAISTDPWTKQGETSRREDAEKIGGGAVLGAIIGAIAGGGKGAAIGAGVGGGAGAGTVMATRGKPVSVPSETVIRFRLASTVRVTEQQIAGR